MTSTSSLSLDDKKLTHPTHIELVSIQLIFDPTSEDETQGAKRLEEDTTDDDDDDSETDNTFTQNYYIDYGTEKNFHDYGGYYHDAIIDFIQPHFPLGYYWDGVVEPVAGPLQLSDLSPSASVIQVPSLDQVPKWNLNQSD